MAATQETQQATQGRTDPRRFGRNNSGLSENDVADVVCILHPTTPAAFRIVNFTAQRNPQHVLQNQGLYISHPQDSGVVPTEADTILVKSGSNDGPRDLALRFSANVSDPTVGFCFGRNEYKCDINLDPEGIQRRVSNAHFRIYINDNGVLMLEDMSTNGTVVDTKLLGGKKQKNGEINPRAMMLQHGSIIGVMSTDEDDAIKFICRQPARDNFMEQYTRNFQAYMSHVEVARERAAVAARQGVAMPDSAARAVMAAPLAGPANTKVIPHPPTMTSRNPMHWDGGGKYNCVGLLGKGAFATVYQIATTFQGEYFAAKELEKKRFMKNGILDERLDNEMTIMRKLRHDNIVQYIEYVETKNHLYIIMEYVPGGDLQGFTQSHGTLPEDLARSMTIQILDALQYLHKKNITHRDIKPDNILICSEAPFVVKLTDFGLSKVVKNNETFLKTFCGTLLYCAPEVFPHYDNYVSSTRPKKRKSNTTRRSYSQLVDIWSYAAVLWTALCGKPPFEGVVDANGRGMFEKIMSSPIDKSPLVDFGISDDACDLLLLMLDTDPSSRPSEAECLRHPWLNGGVWGDDPEPEEEGDMALEAIVEDEEGAEELDASQLDINDHSHDLQSNKRFKPHYQHLRTQSTEDSGEVHPYSQAPVPDAVDDPMAYNQPTKPPKLFGEISQTVPGPALESSGALTGHADPDQRLFSMDGSSNDTSGYGDSRILDLEYELGEDQAMSHDAHQPRVPGGQQDANTSLEKAESMVRGMHMASPKKASSTDHNPDNHRTPNQSQTNAHGTNGTTPQPQQRVRPSQEETPKPRKFDRNIELPITASSYYDPFDPRTHNLEYASSVSGHNFRLEPSTSIAGVTSLPETVHQSFHSSGSSRRSLQSPNHSSEQLRNDEHHQLQNRVKEQKPQHQDPQSAAGAPGAPAELSMPIFPKRNSHTPTVPSPLSSSAANQTPAPAPPLSHPKAEMHPPPLTAITANTTNTTTQTNPPLAILHSTPQSFTNLTLPLQARTTTWGRVPSCTLPHPDPHDTRIPKVGLELVFDPPAATSNNDTKTDWRESKPLKLLILTQSRNGVRVNGVKLQERGPRGGRAYGRLCDGDLVEVFVPKGLSGGAEGGEKEAEKGLSFTVELVAENLAWKRKKGEGFVVSEAVVTAGSGGSSGGSNPAGSNGGANANANANVNAETSAGASENMVGSAGGEQQFGGPLGVERG